MHRGLPTPDDGTQSHIGSVVMACAVVPKVWLASLFSSNYVKPTARLAINPWTT